MNRKLVVGMAATALLAGVGATSANAAATKGGVAQLNCLTQGTGVTCTVNAGTATINQAATGAGALVYAGNNGISGALVGQITQLGFTYTGSLAPRLNIPVMPGTDTDYVFVEGFSCNDGTGKVAVLTDSTCSVAYGASTYPNWAAFVQANPAVRVVTTDMNQPYIIQDTVGSGTVSNVQLGKPTTGKK